MKTKTLGRTGLQVPIVGLGTAFIGIPTHEQALKEYTGPSQMNYELGIATVLAALDAGCGLIDTAVSYGRTRSEEMIGGALRRRPELVKNCLVTTKVGEQLTLGTHDYSVGFITKSIEESLERLGLDCLEIVYVHDAMGASREEIFGKSGVVETLRHFQKRGLIRFIGTASNDPEVNASLIETGEFDAAVVCEAWSMLNQLALERILVAAERHNVGLVIANPLERGLLATGPIKDMTYLGRRFSAKCRAHVSIIKELCEKRGITLPAAALQWCTRYPQVASAIPGARTPEEAVSNLRAGEVQIPETFWNELVPLIRHFKKGEDR